MKNCLSLILMLFSISFSYGQECSRKQHCGGPNLYIEYCLNNLPSDLEVKNNPIIVGLTNSAQLNIGDYMLVSGRAQNNSWNNANYSTVLGWTTSYGNQEISHHGTLSNGEESPYVNFTIISGSDYVEVIGETIRLKEGVAVAGGVDISFTVEYRMNILPLLGCAPVGTGYTFSTQTIRLHFEEGDKVVPSDITISPNEVCLSDVGNFLISITTGYSSSSDYTLYDQHGEIFGSFLGSEIRVLNGDLGSFFNGSRYTFGVTEKSAYGLEQTPIVYVEVDDVISAPAISNLSGDFNVCQNDYTQTYSVSGAANDYSWISTNGTIQSGQGTNTVTVLWDHTKSFWNIAVTGNNRLSDNSPCSANTLNQSVTVNKDIQFFTPGGDPTVCPGGTGEVTLSNSQTGYNYAIFQGNQVPGSSITGTGGQLTWSGFSAGTYEIKVYKSSDCGWYSMGSHEINERAASPPPIIFGDPSRCGDGLYELQAGTGNVNDEFIFYERQGTGYTELGRSNARNGQSSFEVNATSDVNTFGVSYIDEHGCESLIRDVVVDLLGIPVIEIVSNPTICSYESGVSIRDFILQGRNGTASGKIIADNRIFPSLVDEYDRTYTVEYFLPSPNGCSNSTSFELYITPLPTVDLLSDRVEQCVDRGTYDLRNNVLTDNGNTIIFSVDGDAIAGSLINLAGYDLGEHEITIAIEGENTCENEQSFILEITSVNEIVIPPSELTYCPGFTEISLSAIFSGYTGVIKVNGTTMSSGVLRQASGVWNIGDNVLSFTEDQPCGFEQVYNLYIEPVPVLDIGSDLFVCEEDGEINLMFSDRQGTVPVTPPGGEWTGRFENRNLFNASSAVNGTYEMTYTVEINGCTHSASKNVIVNQTPNVFVGGDFSLCRNSEGFPLRSLPNVPGGVWEGSLAIGEQDIYYPGLEEGSTNVVTLTYTFTDNNQCSGSDQVRISLTDVPTITASVPSYSFCVNDDPYNVLQDIREADVTVTSQDGGVSGGRILPDIMGVGTHEILVQREVNGCFNTITLPVDIRGADNIVFPEQSICVNAPTLNLLTYLPGGSPTNGQFVGKGVFEGNKIVPPEVGSGTEFYTYSVQNDSECNIKGTLRLVIHPVPVQPEVDQVYYSCAEGDQFEISVNNVNESQQYTWYTGDNEVIGQGPTLGIDDHVSLNGYVVATSDQGCAIRSGDFEVLSSDLSGSGRSLPENEVKTGEWIQFFNDIEAARYEWKFSNGIESTDKNPILVFNDVNEWVSADLTVISEFGCTRTYTGIDSVYVNDDSNEYVITNPSRENDGLVLKQNDTKFRLYPTPSTNQRVTLSFQSIQDEKVEIKIYDMMNKSLVDGVFYDVVTGDNDLFIDISELPEGMFVVSVLGSQWKKMNFLVGVKSSR